jgi:hypothetical protein
VLDFGTGWDEGEDRTRLIEKAAGALDRQAAHMGPGQPAPHSEAGDIARAFADDQAQFGRPVLHRLDTSTLDPAAQGIPVTREELLRSSSFYFVSFPVSLYSRPGRGFNRLEVKVEFNPGDEGRRPVTFDVLPDQEWANRFQVDADVSVGVRADLRLALDVPQELTALAGVPVGGSAGATGGGGVKLLAGPFKYAVRVPQVEHTPPEHDHVFWRLDGGRFQQEQDPGLRAVLAVPHSAGGLRITARMQATRYYPLLQSGLKAAIANLAPALRSFFTSGTPILARGDWDLGEDL